ncbi:MAG: RNA polymerase sigma factor [Fimbriiglobus sp.]
MFYDLSATATHVSLLGRLRDPGDMASWELFVRTYGTAVYNYCRRRGLQDSDAADLVQEVLAQVMVSIRTFDYDPSRGRFRDWLGMVTRGKLARHWRNASKNGHVHSDHKLDDIASNGIDPEWTAELENHLLHVAMESIQDAFDPTNWKAFERTWVHNEPTVEVAASLGIPVAQVYVAKSRIAKRLAEELHHLTDDIPWLAGPR